MDMVYHRNQLTSNLLRSLLGNLDGDLAFSLKSIRGTVLRIFTIESPVARLSRDLVIYLQTWPIPEDHRPDRDRAQIEQDISNNFLLFTDTRQSSIGLRCLESKLSNALFSFLSSIRCAEVSLREIAVANRGGSIFAEKTNRESERTNCSVHGQSKMQRRLEMLAH